MDECKLREKKCGPCNDKTPQLNHEEIEQYRLAVPNWTPVWGYKIHRTFRFNNFRAAVVFIEQIAIIAETENHTLIFSFTTASTWP